MKYFITGATGFVGSHLLHRLLETGHAVTALVRNPGRAGDLESAGARLIEGDLSDLSALARGMDGAEGVFHIAGWYKVGVDERDEAWQVNVQGTRNVLEIMAKSGVRKGVYTSTLAVNSDTRGIVVDEEYVHRGAHVSLYDETKWIAHHEVAEPMIEAGLPLVVVMPGVIHGPGDKSLLGESLRNYLRGRLRFVPTQSMICLAHLDDIVDGHILAMERGRVGQTYIIAGHPISYMEIMELASEFSGIYPSVLHISPGLMRASAFLMRGIERIISVPPEFTSESLRVLAGVTYLGSNEKAKVELGYQPRPLRKTLQGTIAALLEELEQEDLI